MASLKKEPPHSGTTLSKWVHRRDRQTQVQREDKLKNAVLEIMPWASPHRGSEPSMPRLFNDKEILQLPSWVENCEHLPRGFGCRFVHSCFNPGLISAKGVGYSVGCSGGMHVHFVFVV